ncbi:hypothetical protein PFISCL1PPCAC_21575, partial [Pristionchus fissidentatus]
CLHRQPTRATAQTADLHNRREFLGEIIVDFDLESNHSTRLGVWNPDRFDLSMLPSDDVIWQS